MIPPPASGGRMNRRILPWLGVAVILAAGAWMLVPALPAADSAAPAVAPAASSGNAGASGLDRLDGTRWIIDLKPMYHDTPAGPEHDTLRFLDGTLTSDWLNGDGFAPAPVALSAGAETLVDCAT